LPLDNETTKKGVRKLVKDTIAAYYNKHLKTGSKYKDGNLDLDIIFTL